MFSLQSLGGLPFVSTNFDTGRLASAVVAVRSIRAQRLNACLDGGINWFDPVTACLTRRPLVPLLLDRLSEAYDEAITQAIDSLMTLFPVWRPYFALPIRYCAMPSELSGISGSIIDYPQHIMLSDETLHDVTELPGQLLHEMCHQWLYLVEELWPLQTSESVLIELPSGTPDRQPREVLGAAHVAVALAMYHRELSDRHPGVGLLVDYARKCLVLLDEAADFVTLHGAQCVGTLKGILDDPGY